MSEIKETKEAVAFLAKVALAVKKALEDGKFSIGDVVYFSGAVMAASAAIGEVGEIPSELSDLSTAEALELVEVAVKEIPEMPEKSVEIVKASLKLVVAGVELYKAVKA